MQTVHGRGEREGQGDAWEAAGGRLAEGEGKGPGSGRDEECWQKNTL